MFEAERSRRASLRQRAPNAQHADRADRCRDRESDDDALEKKARHADEDSSSEYSDSSGASVMLSKSMR